MFFEYFSVSYQKTKSECHTGEFILSGMNKIETTVDYIVR